MKRTRWIWWTTAALVTIGLCLCFTTWFTTILQAPLTLHEQPQAVDVIVVLGAGARRQGEPLPPQAKERVMRGVQLLQQGYASTLIMSGGLSKAGYVESDLMTAYAKTLGVPDAQLIAEQHSKNTWDNANESLAIMAEHDWHSALVVTSPYHTLRSCTIFRRLQADVRCIDAPLTLIPTNTVYERLTDFRSVVREYGAIIYFLLKHYL